MLSARLQDQTVLIFEKHWETQEQVLRAAAKERRLTAPCCGAPVVVKWGLRKVRHFAHLPGKECPYDRWSEPESAEHAAGKVLLYEWCRRKFGGRLRLLALEHPLPETLQRPDVYFELDDGSRYALEYQRSPISPGEWRERHEAYERLGIHALWILGENRLADALPTEAQQARWAAKEPHMHFLKVRAFEADAAVRTPYEVAWWRGEQQEELWAPQELDARFGREVSPWYRRSALNRLRSLTFLDAVTGQVTIYRAMRELPAHVDTKMASVMLRAALDELTLTPCGLVTPADEER
ncbi:MAG TPA: competence protein CoiA family protein, partial [Symbiobacteriaceae bacterium]|nr:competence protein CoiA family protein [Symbiobacteriaceae bacterium]